ncbi:sigma-70 family RNA polymerase sigma factor [Paenibacillus sp. LMG 31459]|uniref:Sigma-70 family RNA polymerase sigma factor n=1 Tax=Paenibacillus phytohabitans TaxID=2654978 RepID=A0ABX1YC13_9BACL|nr:sigma-70 family RNA polymerase sigma factor [Paenibacillus phytohabitans]
MNDFKRALSEVEEKKLLNDMSNEDLISRNLLIEHNLRLVHHIAKKFEHMKEDFDDLLSIGVQGLIKAIDTFAIDKGFRLTTYAARCIENEILMYLRSKKDYNYEASEALPEFEIQKFISSNNLPLKIHNATDDILLFKHIDKLIVFINDIVKTLKTSLALQLSIMKSDDNYLTIQLDSIIKDPYLYEINIFTIVFSILDSEETKFEMVYNFESTVVSDIDLLQPYISEAIAEALDKGSNHSNISLPPLL